MIDYFVYFFVASIVFWIGYKNNTKKSYIFCLIVLFSFTAFRYKYFGGTDSYIYNSYFQNSVSFEGIFNNNVYGVGYAFLNWIVRAFTDNYYVFQIIYAAITIVLLDIVLRELDYSWGELCVVLFTYLCLRFIYNEWVALRQNIANLIFWFVLLRFYKLNPEERKKHIIPSILILASTYLFHTSSIVAIILFVGVYAMEKIPFNRKVFLVPLLSIGLRLFGDRLFATIISFMVTRVSDRYMMYINSDSLSSNAIYFILRLLFFVIYCYGYHSNNSRNKESVLNIMSVMIIVSSLDFQIISRVFEYFAIGLYASSGKFFDVFDANRESRVIAELIFYFCMMIVFLRFVGYFGQGYEPIIPYRTLFFK